MSPRLTLAARAGAFGVDAPVLLLHPPLDVDLSLFGSVRVVTDMMPDASVWASRGIKCDAALSTDKVDCCVVFLPRSKKAARDRIARVSAMAGRVLVDGSKTDGIESILKDVKKRAAVGGTVSKAHGKLFWFDGGGDFSDWVAAPALVDGHWHVRPGVFSADGVDPGSKLLVDNLQSLSGSVADLGAGWGYLSACALERNQDITALHLVEAQGMALGCARDNVTDTRAEFHWADATTWDGARNLDVVIMNPPFHTGRKAEPDLGRAFIARAARLLRRGGTLWMVANRHLPYEATLATHFTTVEEFGGDNRFKLLRGTALARPAR